MKLTRKRKGNTTLTANFEKLNAHQKAFVRFASATAVFAISIFMLFTITGVRMKAQVAERMAMSVQASGEIAQPMTIMLSAHADKEAVDLQLVSPTGVIYDASNADSYVIDGDSVTMTVTATEVGAWQARTNRKSNSQIGVEFTSDYIDKLFLQNIDTYINTAGEHMISFDPLFGDGSAHSEFKFEVSATNDVTGETVIVSEGVWQMNYHQSAVLDISQLTLPGNWYLSVNTEAASDVEFPEDYVSTWQSDVPIINLN